jgi:hypothetical protein
MREPTALAPGSQRKISPAGLKLDGAIATMAQSGPRAS